MAKESTNISHGADLKKASQEFYADFGMDLTTAVTIFLKQFVRKQGIPFKVSREVPNAENVAAMNEFREMKENTGNYKRYATFREAMDEVLTD